MKGEKKKKPNKPKNNRRSQGQKSSQIERVEKMASEGTRMGPAMRRSSIVKRRKKNLSRGREANSRRSWLTIAQRYAHWDLTLKNRAD